jgi:hypothetical protein
MKARACGGTGPGDISAVLRDLRLHQHHIQQRFFTSMFLGNTAESSQFARFPIVCQTFWKINPKILNFTNIS